MSKKIGLLAVFVVIFVLLCGTLFAGGKAEEKAAAPATVAVTTRYNEAPGLASRVAAGELPTVDERLPPQPVVVQPVESIGQYGGTLQIGIVGPTVFYGDPQSAISTETLFRLSPPDYTEIVPGVARDWEFQNDGKTLIVYLNEGLRWSDGHPFTTESFRFWYEDILLNPDLTPVPPVQWSPGGELMTVTIIDDYTARFDFAVPYPIAQYHFAHYQGFENNYPPSHYLEQFHPNYVDRAELTRLARAEGFDEWHQRFNNRRQMGSGIPRALGLPTLGSHFVTSISPEGYTYERNPYYWKVDPAGNQLPYIDTVRLNVITDREVLNIKALQGELSIYAENATISDYPLFRENQDSGGYRLMQWRSVYGNQMLLQPNQTVEDPVLREIFRDLRFRIALSLALNRSEMNETLYFGLGSPMQATMGRASSYFNEEFAQAYAEYDPARANQLLDEMGLSRGRDGYRVRPDGRRLTINLEYPQAHAMAPPLLELIVDYLGDIGVDLQLRQLSNELQNQRIAGNQIQMTQWYADKVMDHTFVMAPMWFVPYNFNWETSWGTRWAQWYVTGGREGEEPPAEAKRLLDIWDRMKETVDDDERVALGMEILKSQAENLWVIGTVGDVPLPIIVDARLGNIPEEGVHGFDTIRMQPNHPETFFFKTR